MEIGGNQRVLITGAASGLGPALTKEFVARGCRVLALDIHELVPASLAGLAMMTSLKSDVTKDADWDRAREWVSQQMSKKD